MDSKLRAAFALYMVAAHEDVSVEVANVIWQRWGLGASQEAWTPISTPKVAIEEFKVWRLAIRVEVIVS